MPTQVASQNGNELVGIFQPALDAYGHYNNPTAANARKRRALLENVSAAAMDEKLENAGEQPKLKQPLEDDGMFQLNGRHALITGGTQGVGAAIAQTLAKAGCEVTLVGLEETPMAVQTLERCRSHGVAANVYYYDLSRPPASWVEALLAEIEASSGGGAEVSLLVNNAGTCRDRPFLDMDFETFQMTMQLNVAAGYFLTQALARKWCLTNRPPDWYRVLFTGSINGLLSEQDHSCYDASKGAVHALVRSLCVGLSPWGIRVNALAPGLVVTPLTSPALAPDSPLLDWMKLHTPNGRVPDASVCGPSALYLLSDEASHVNGQIHFVDGGMSAWQQPDPPSQ